MKKLINLIALVMLVSTNVLTHLSYAQVETPEAIPENEVENIVESGETPEYMDAFSENVSNDLGEIEQENQDDETSEDILQNIQEDVESPAIDETENVDTENNEEDQPGEETSENEIQDENPQGDETEDEFLLQKAEDVIVMQVEPGTTVTLLPGQQFNSVIKTLANGGTEVAYAEVNNNIQSFQRVDLEPAGVTTGEISIAGSEYPVYARFSGGVLYYATQAETIQLNEDSQSMFGGFSGLTGLDLSSWDISNVTNMSRMFSGCANIEDLILDNWDFSNNPNRGGMFNGITGLETLSAKNWIIPETFNSAFGCTNAMLCAENITIDVSNWDLSKAKNLKQLFFISYAKEIKGLDTWDTSSITNMNGMFQRSSITKLDLSNWNTSNVTDMSQMFYECRDLEEIDVSTWNTSKVTNMYEMFRDCDKLEELDLRHFDVSNVTNMCEMFQDCNNLKILNLEGRDVGNMTRGNIGNIIHYCNNLEELNLSGWDFRNIGGERLFTSNLSSYQLSKVKKLNMTNTKFSGSMYSSFSGIPNVEEIKFDGIDTSNVTDMHEMFAGCGKLTGLDLSNWNTNNVSRVDNMFTYCNNLQGVNMSGRDFRNASANNLFVHYGNETGIRYVDMTNARFSGNLSFIFGQIKNVEKINLKGVDTSNVTYMSSMFNGCSKLTGLDLSDFDTHNVKDVSSMFYGCSGLTELNLNNWDTSNITSMGAMVGGCKQLKELNLSGWDFRKSGINMMNMTAGGIPSLKILNMRNTKFSGSMNSAFNSLTGLQQINMEGADTSNVTTMIQMFQSCINLTGLNLSGWDTSNVTGMNSMFNGCSKLENLNLNGRDFSKNPIMNSMLNGTSSLKTLSLKNWTIPESFTNIMRASSLSTTSLDSIDVSNWNFSGTKNLYGLFGDLKAKEIKGLNTWDTSGVTNMSQMFYGCSNLTGLDLGNRNTENVTNMNDMFNGCSNLISLDLSNWDTSNVTGMNTMFVSCTGLEKLNLNNWDLSNNPSMGGLIANTPSLKYISMSGRIIPENFNDKISRNWAGGSSPIEEIDVTNWNLSQTKNIQGVFADSRNLKTTKGLNTWNTSGIQNMNYMFQNCSGLQNLDLSNFNTSNVTSMNAIFGGCNQLEELNLSGRDFRKAGPDMKNMTAGGNSSINKLNITNAKYGTNMYQAFAGLSNLEKIEGLDTLDTINVTNMSSMFNGCSNLTGLDLSNWDISSVTNMGSIFAGCSKLENLDLSGWDFRNINNASLMSMMGLPSTLLKILNMTNTKYTGNVTYAFGGLTKLEELKLEGADTSNVTDMNAMFNGDGKLKNLNLSSFNTSKVLSMSAMFYNCGNLTGLDLSNFDTSNVTSMGAMFYNTPNLKTIYASEKFVTTALSGDTSSKDMFSGTTSVVGGNGTKFDPNYIDEEYALIDKVGQTGYFTDKNAINVKFINTLDGTETLATFAKGQKLTPPYVDKYHVVGGYLDEEMTQAIDLNKGVDTYTVIYVKYDRNGSSGGGGGGGGSKDTDKDTHGSAEDSQKNTQDDKDTENVIQNETKGSEEPSNTSMDSSADKSASEGQEILSPSDSPSSAGQVSFTKEQKDAYTFAKENGITTKDTIQSAQMNGKLTRIAMAKMLSQYAINVLGQTPDTSKTVKFKDVSNKKDADYDNGVTLAYQLGIMGQNMPNNRFRPNDEVSRAEFATALSRLLYQTTDGKYKSTKEYYIPHMAKLYNEGIISNTDPSMAERRGYVMIMLMRSAK